MRIAILDDYQQVALALADWGSLPGAEVVAFADHVSDPDLLVRRLSEFDAVCLTRERTRLTRPILERLPRLRLILATGGHNEVTIDMETARARKVTVCQTRSFATATVEITWWLLLSLFRKATHEHAGVRAGGWQMRLGHSVWERTLGVIGLGKLGIPVAQVAKAFGMQVIAWSPNLTPERAEAVGVRAVSKQELLSTADAITIHMPLSERSRHIVDEADINQMRPQTYLVNTSRARLVNQEALLGALRAGRIAGYGVDVFEEEPLPRDHPFRYLPQVISTPHIGYVVEQGYRVYFGDCVANARAFMEGNPIRVLA